MSLRLERLVYESAATGTTESFGNLAVILAESERNNDRDGLTGALAAHRDRYVQVIEGPAQTLDALLRRLEGDPRHRDIVVIGREPITERRFGRWTMANARITPDHAAALDELIDRRNMSAARIVGILLEAVGGRD
ncbi:MAG TPA: BLUF domain-containing protein [Brevundimonas sp.]|nr:BLUF domain-containing protein [Brevundimonas sp.]